MALENSLPRCQSSIAKNDDCEITFQCGMAEGHLGLRTAEGRMFDVRKVEWVAVTLMWLK